MSEKPIDLADVERLAKRGMYENWPTPDDVVLLMQAALRMVKALREMNLHFIPLDWDRDGDGKLMSKHGLTDTGGDDGNA